MHILISGATGSVGRELCPVLIEAGHTVIGLTRNTSRAAENGPAGVEWVQWNGRDTHGWEDAVERADAVINLAGENIAGGRWTDQFKKRILESRTNAGEVISEAMLNAKQKPALLIQASAIGIYGSQGDTILDETSPTDQDGFLEEVTRQWEASVKPVADAGIPVVYMRIGVVLSRVGGILEKMLLPFKMFAGGPVGSGEQWLSWIHVDDLVAAIQMLVTRKPKGGLYNMTAPNPAQMSEFSRVFGKALNRPSWLPVPSFAIKILFQEMGENTALASTRVLPKALLAEGYEFRFPDLDSALADLAVNL